MRPLLSRLADVDRRALALGGVVLVALVAAGVTAVATSRGGGERAEVVEPPAATATPTAAFVLPPLPAGCLFSSNFGPTLQRVDEALSIEVREPECASGVWRDVPLDRMVGELTLNLDAPDGPAQLLVRLQGSEDAGARRWTGTVRFPLAGYWRPELRIGGQPVTLSAVWLVLNGSGLVSIPGLPLPAMDQAISVVNVDRAGEPVRWPAAWSLGIAWIPGRAVGEAARAVWVQSSEGRDWVVAGDPTTGIVTRLFEVESLTSLAGAPDGRGFIAMDRLDQPAPRVRMYDAQTGRLTDVPVEGPNPILIAWAPDSSVALVGSKRLSLVGSDGTVAAVDGVPIRPIRMNWAPDSRSAFATLSEAGSCSVVRVDVAARSAAPVFDVPMSGVYWQETVFSPDGRSVAFTWMDTRDDSLRLLVFGPDDPLPVPARDRAVVSFPLAGAPMKLFGWLASPVWSPDGQQLAFALGLPEADGSPRVRSSIQMVDLRTRAVREIATPSQGYYASGQLWWSTDGSALVKQWFGCVACDGGTSGLDMIDAANGGVVRTIERGMLLGSLDGVRQLIGTPGGLISVRGLEPPRVMAPAAPGVPTGLSVIAPSPDGNRLAAIQMPGYGDPVLAVTSDGLSRAVLGSVRFTEAVGLVDATKALVFERGMGWAWATLMDGGRTPLPMPPRPDVWNPTYSAISRDKRVVAYWASAVDPSLLRLVTLDTGSGIARELPQTTARSEKPPMLEVAPGGSRIAYVEGNDLVLVDAASGDVRRVGLVGLGLGPDEDARLLPLAWRDEGRLDVLAGKQLWSIEAASAATQVTSRLPPLPGGWRGSARLSRSPDGRQLVALTATGLFELEADGMWRLISSAGAGWLSPFPTRIVWSPDSNRVAYAGVQGAGLVVASLDGSGAYELLRPDPTGRAIELLDWLPDGRIVYALVAQGL